jgi:magnesium-protoporphyrin IX monomethyl ester (oxidative) cyclase
MANIMMMSGSLLGSRIASSQRVSTSKPCTPAPFRAARQVRVQATSAPAAQSDLGFKTMRQGVKEAAAETILTPRFYTTDFDEMEEMFSLEKNPNLPMEELDAMLKEFK